MSRLNDLKEFLRQTGWISKASGRTGRNGEDRIPSSSARIDAAAALSAFQLRVGLFWSADEPLLPFSTAVAFPALQLGDALMACGYLERQHTGLFL